MSGSPCSNMTAQNTSMSHLIEVYAATLDEWQTTKEIASKVNKGHREARKFLARLAQVGLIGYRFIKIGRFTYCQYKAGESKDPIPISSRKAKSIVPNESAIMFGVIMNGLKTPMTVLELREYSGMEYHALLRFVKAARKAKIIHIHGYIERTKIYAFGRRHDASKPKVKPRTLINLEQRIKMKQAKMRVNSVFNLPLAA